MRSSADIQDDIDRLNKEYEEAKDVERGPWPRRITIRVLGCPSQEAELIRDKLYDSGETLGLKHDQCRTLSTALDELCITLEVDESGVSRMVKQKKAKAKAPLVYPYVKMVHVKHVTHPIMLLVQSTGDAQILALNGTPTEYTKNEE